MYVVLMNLVMDDNQLHYFYNPKLALLSKNKSMQLLLFCAEKEVSL